MSPALLVALLLLGAQPAPPEARQLKETLAGVLVENRLLKKSVLGDGENAS